MLWCYLTIGQSRLQVCSEYGQKNENYLNTSLAPSLFATATPNVECVFCLNITIFFFWRVDFYVCVLSYTTIPRVRVKVLLSSDCLLAKD